MSHANEDYDSLGAALGIAAMARHLEKPCHIIVSQLGTAVEKLADLLEENEDYQDILMTPAQAAEMIDGIDPNQVLLFVVDTHRPEMTAAPELLRRLEKVIVLDHHRRAESFIANPLLVYLEPSSSSTAELISELLMYFDTTIDLTRLEASALYAGILVDTKNFADQTGFRTFEAASYLRRAGADPHLARQLFRVDLESLQHRAEVISNAHLLPGGIIVSACPLRIKNVQMVSAQAADMLLNLEEVKVSFVLFPLDEDTIGISARSQGEINVQVIMEQLGGGGHQTMAGAQLKTTDLEEAKRQLIEIVTRYVEESELE
nr:DHH family phosphoesterase [Acetonema longum]